MKVLVTGGDGFVGGWLIRALRAASHQVTATRRAQARGPVASVLSDGEAAAIPWLPLELTDAASVHQLAKVSVDAVIHLAAVSSVGESCRDPERCWEVNSLGTVRLLEALSRSAEQAGVEPPKVILASTGEVYGPGDSVPRSELSPVRPVSPYAASKLAAEWAVAEAGRRVGFEYLIARPFSHTGPGQSAGFVAPAFARRILEARRLGMSEISVGNLGVVRDLLDVRDVVRAYLALLEFGVSGQIYNIARGEGIQIGDLLTGLLEAAEYEATPVIDPALARKVDIPHLVGDATKLKVAAGWSPQLSLNQTLKDLLDAQAD